MKSSMLPRLPQLLAILALALSNQTCLYEKQDGVNTYAADSDAVPPTDGGKGDDSRPTIPDTDITPGDDTQVCSTAGDAIACCSEGTCGYGVCTSVNGAVACTCDVGFALPSCAVCATDINDNSYTLFDQSDDSVCSPQCAAAGLACTNGCRTSVGSAACVCPDGGVDSNGDGICEPSSMCSTEADHIDCPCADGQFADLSSVGLCFTDCPDTGDCLDTPTGPLTNVCAIYVDGSNGRIGAAGTSWDMAVNTLEKAVSLASSKRCSYIWVRGDPNDTYANVSYSESILTIPTLLTIIGGFTDGDDTYADWQRRHRFTTRSYLPRLGTMLWTDPGRAPLSVLKRRLKLGHNITIMGFDFDGQNNVGPAITVGSDVTATIERSLFRNWTEGALEVDAIQNNTTLNVMDTLFVGNTATNAVEKGAAITAKDAVLVLHRSAFIANIQGGTGGKAGAIRSAGTTVSIEDSYFGANTGFSAGALFFDAAGQNVNLNIRRTIFTGNQGISAGAIASQGGTPGDASIVVHNSLFVNNLAKGTSESGTAISNIYTTRVSNCTFLRTREFEPAPLLQFETDKDNTLNGTLMVRMRARTNGDPAFVVGPAVGDNNASSETLCSNCTAISPVIDPEDAVLAKKITTNATKTGSLWLLNSTGLPLNDRQNTFVLLNGNPTAIPVLRSTNNTLLIYALKSTINATVGLIDFTPRGSGPLIDAGFGTRKAYSIDGAYDLNGNTAVDIVRTQNTGNGLPPYRDIGCFERQEQN